MICIIAHCVENYEMSYCANGYFVHTDFKGGTAV